MNLSISNFFLFYCGIKKSILMRILNIVVLPYWGDESVAKDLGSTVREVSFSSHLQEEGIVKRLQTA